METLREYYPLVKKTAYFSKHVNGLIRNFFLMTHISHLSSFTNETNCLKKEPEELKK
jgi:hypothetical protein